MDRSTRALLGMVVGLSLAAPAMAFGEPPQRGGGSGSSSSSGQAVPRSSGGSSSSSSGGSTSSGGSSSGGGESRATPPPPPPPPSSDNSDRRTPTSSSSRTGSTAKSRTSGSSGTSSGAATPSGRANGTTSATAGVDGSRVSARDRNGRPIAGVAVPRSTVGGIATFPIYSSYRYYSPWYGVGYGWNFGFAAYDPWFYGPGWAWGRYGFWYSPYSFYPYDPYYSPSYYGTQRYEDEESRPARRTAMGSLRIKASPSTARVYVDGTLVGTVDDFDGLSHHLEVELGAHRVELRAEGYTNMSQDVNVTPGTSTIRMNLKKK